MQLEQQLQGLSKPRRFFERLEHLAPRASISGLFQGLSQLKMDFGGIRRV